MSADEAAMDAASRLILENRVVSLELNPVEWRERGRPEDIVCVTVTTRGTVEIEIPLLFVHQVMVSDTGHAQCTCKTAFRRQPPEPLRCAHVCLVLGALAGFIDVYNDMRYRVLCMPWHATNNTLAVALRECVAKNADTPQQCLEIPVVLS